RATDESASDYATWPPRHERAVHIDGPRRRPYIAAHAKRFYDQCQAPPPSLPRYGTSTRPPVKTRNIRAAGSAELSLDILPRIRPDPFQQRLGSCLRLPKRKKKRRKPGSACSAPPATPVRNCCGS